MEDTKIKVEPDLNPPTDPLLFDNSDQIIDPTPDVPAEETNSLKSFRILPKENLKNVRILKPESYYEDENFFVASGIVGKPPDIKKAVKKPSETNKITRKPPEIKTETVIKEEPIEITEDDYRYDLNGNTDVSR